MILPWGVARRRLRWPTCCRAPRHSELNPPNILPSIRTVRNESPTALEVEVQRVQEPGGAMSNALGRAPARSWRLGGGTRPRWARH
ncbi:hypothetical protein NDU88_003653 [Pleurodeles waltl]|uniref:Uncharacterized protein n=1 Tax=Pleurodeles waltl TaxID=8319 RepID=A0AAV7SGJ4_PLEWA|nr:hypothetical protein NDU88_003653 [Pleurodeles waltl]